MSAAQLLQWHIEMGADEAIGDEPINRLNAKEPIFALPNAVSKMLNTATPQTSAPQPAAPVAIAVPTEALIEAEKLAKGCDNLESLIAAVNGFTGLSIHKTANHCFFLQGNLTSKILILTDAPSSDDDRTGVLLSGDAGTLWDNILKHSPLTKDDYAISPAVFWRPPGNRRPTEQEMSCCIPFIKKAIELMEPQHIIILGASCYNSLFKENTTVARIQNQPVDYIINTTAESTDKIPCFIFESPTKLLKQPSQKANFWKNLIKIEKF